MEKMLKEIIPKNIYEKEDYLIKKHNGSLFFIKI